MNQQETDSIILVAVIGSVGGLMAVSRTFGADKSKCVGGSTIFFRVGPIEFLTNKQSMTSTKTRAVYKQIIDEINQNISNFIGEVNFID